MKVDTISHDPETGLVDYDEMLNTIINDIKENDPDFLCGLIEYLYPIADASYQVGSDEIKLTLERWDSGSFSDIF